MSAGTLDKFFGTKPPLPEERCSNPKCHRKLDPKETRFSLTVKGEEKVYCQDCYKAKLRPREDSEESI